MTGIKTNMLHQLLLIFVFNMLISCGAITRLELPPLPEQDFEQSEVQNMNRKNRPFGSFGYWAYSDSLIRTAYIDSTLTHGILIPRSSYELTALEYKMRYGSDSQQCFLHYMELKTEHASENYSMLGSILFPRTEPAYHERTTTYTTLHRVLYGIMYDSLSCDTIRFYFEQKGTEFNLDSNAISGYFRCGADSFFVQPSFKVIDIKGRNAKDMYLLQGYALRKSDQILGFLLHAPNYRSRRDVLYLRRHLSARQQMQFSAFFSLISRVTNPDTGVRLF